MKDVFDRVMAEEMITVAYLARLAGVSRKTVWQNIRELQPVALSLRQPPSPSSPKGEERQPLLDGQP